MTNLNKNITSTTNKFKAFGEAVNVPYRVTLRDYRLASETRPSNYGKGLYNDNLYDLMGVVQNGKLVLSSRWQSEIGPQGGYDLNDTVGIENAIKSWESMVKEKGRILVTDDSSKSKITRKFLLADPAPVDSPEDTESSPADKPASASKDDTVNPYLGLDLKAASTFLGAKATKVATTFMGQTLVSGLSKDVVTFPDNPAYNISVTYDSETGYTVKAPIRGITKNGKVFKNAKDAQRAIAKYETAIKKHLAKTKKPEQNANPYAEALKTPDLLNVFDPKFKINGLEEYKMPDTKSVKGFDPNFKIEGLEKYKIPATDFTGPLFQTD